MRTAALKNTLLAHLRPFVPPVLLRAYRRYGRRYGWSGDYASWDEALRACGSHGGYDSAEILERCSAAALKVQRGEAAYERDSVTFTTPEYSWHLLGALMWVAAQNRGHLDVLDFGGSLGSTYFQHRLFFERLPQVRWNVVEQEHFVARGKELYETEQLRFFTSIEACRADCTPTVVVLSSVLQYLQDPHQFIRTLLTHGFDSIIVELTPVHPGTRDHLTVQRVPPQIYRASYPCWFFAQANLCAAFAQGYRLVTDFDSALGQQLPGNHGLRARYRGFIFAREDAGAGEKR
jgi:putative methyltransferase (TIGR04325 family)